MADAISVQAALSYVVDVEEWRKMRGLMAASYPDFDPLKHPRGKDGKFIKVGKWVRFLKYGKWYAGTVKNINDGGDITVFSPKANKDVLIPNDMAPQQIFTMPQPKAHLDLPDITKSSDKGFIKVGGQGGSNPGGMYELTPQAGILSTPFDFLSVKNDQGEWGPGPGTGTSNLEMVKTQINAALHDVGTINSSPVVLPVPYGPTGTGSARLAFVVSPKGVGGGMPPIIAWDFMRANDGALVAMPFNAGGAGDTDPRAVALRKKVDEGIGALLKAQGVKVVDPDWVDDTSATPVEDTAPEKWYVKKAKSPEHAKNEWLANNLYERAGVSVPKTVTDNNWTTVGSQVSSGPGRKSLLEADGEELAAIRKDFVLDAWLANWDVVGLEYDNLIIVDGVPQRIDAGGAMLFRAQGSPKGKMFGPEVGELQSMRDPNMNTQAHKIFGPTTETELADGGKRLAAISPEEIKALVDELDMDNGDLVASTLIARRSYILNDLGIDDPFDGADTAAPAPELDMSTNPETPPQPVVEAPVIMSVPEKGTLSLVTFVDGSSGEWFFEGEENDVQWSLSPSPYGGAPLSLGKDQITSIEAIGVPPSIEEKVDAAPAVQDPLLDVIDKAPDDVAPATVGLPISPGHVALKTIAVDDLEPGMTVVIPRQLDADTGSYTGIPIYGKVTSSDLTYNKTSFGVNTTLNGDSGYRHLVKGAPVTIVEPLLAEQTPKITLKQDGLITANGVGIGSYQEVQMGYYSTGYTISIPGAFTHDGIGIENTFSVSKPTLRQMIARSTFLPAAYVPKPKKKKNKSVNDKATILGYKKTAPAEAKLPDSPSGYYLEGQPVDKGTKVFHKKTGKLGTITGWPASDDPKYKNIVYFKPDEGGKTQPMSVKQMTTTDPSTQVNEFEIDGVVWPALDDGTEPTKGKHVTNTKLGESGTITGAPGFEKYPNILYVKPDDGTKTKSWSAKVLTTYVDEKPTTETLVGAIDDFVPITDEVHGYEPDVLSIPKQDPESKAAWLEPLGRKLMADNQVPYVGMPVKDKKGVQYRIIGTASPSVQSNSTITLLTNDGEIFKKQSSVLSFDEERFLSNEGKVPAISSAHFTGVSTSYGSKKMNTTLGELPLGDGDLLFRYVPRSAYTDKKQMPAYMVVRPDGSVQIWNGYSSYGSTDLDHIQGFFQGHNAKLLARGDSNSTKHLYGYTKQYGGGWIPTQIAPTSKYAVVDGEENETPEEVFAKHLPLPAPVELPADAGPKTAMNDLELGHSYIVKAGSFVETWTYDGKSPLGSYKFETPDGPFNMGKSEAATGDYEFYQTTPTTPGGQTGNLTAFGDLKIGQTYVAKKKDGTKSNTWTFKGKDAFGGYKFETPHGTPFTSTQMEVENWDFHDLSKSGDATKLSPGIPVNVSSLTAQDLADFMKEGDTFTLSGPSGSVTKLTYDSADPSGFIWATTEGSKGVQEFSLASLGGYDFTPTGSSTQGISQGDKVTYGPYESKVWTVNYDFGDGDVQLIDSNYDSVTVAKDELIKVEGEATPEVSKYKVGDTVLYTGQEWSVDDTTGGMLTLKDFAGSEVHVSADSSFVTKPSQAPTPAPAPEPAPEPVTPASPNVVFPEDEGVAESSFVPPKLVQVGANLPVPPQAKETKKKTGPTFEVPGPTGQVADFGSAPSVPNSYSIMGAVGDLLDNADSTAAGTGITKALGDTDQLSNMDLRFQVVQYGTDSYVEARLKLMTPAADSLGSQLLQQSDSKTGGWDYIEKYVADLNDGDAISIRQSEHTTPAVLKPADNAQPNARIVGEPVKVITKGEGEASYDTFRFTVMMADGTTGEVDIQDRDTPSVRMYTYNPDKIVTQANVPLHITDEAVDAGWSILYNGLAFERGEVDGEGRKFFNGTMWSQASSGKFLGRTLDDGTQVRFNYVHPSQGSHGYDSARWHTIANEAIVRVPIDAKDFQQSLADGLETLGIDPETLRPPTKKELADMAVQKLAWQYDRNWTPGKNYSDLTADPDNIATQKMLTDITKQVPDLGRPVTLDDIWLYTQPDGSVVSGVSPEMARASAKAQKRSYYSHTLYNDGYSAITPDLKDNLESILSRANDGMLPTDERWSQGVVTSGMSSSQDMGIGSGDRMYYHAQTSKSLYAGGDTITVILSPTVINLHADAYLNPSDNYGRRSPGNRWISPGEKHETMLKMGLPKDMIAYVSVPQPHRDEMLGRLKQNGVTEIGGRPIEEVIITPKELAQKPVDDDFANLGMQDVNGVSVANLIGST